VVELELPIDLVPVLATSEPIVPAVELEPPIALVAELGLLVALVAAWATSERIGLAGAGQTASAIDNFPEVPVAKEAAPSAVVAAE
jgi:hypothetical protein